MGAAFKVAGILLLFIAGIFVVYANAIFLKRRSREIGLYQLIGLTRGSVSRLLIIENSLLSAGALAIGIGIGILVSRVFLILLMKLIGFDGFIEVEFSTAAVIQTVIVFLGITILTSMQMLVAVYRNTLLGLFNAEKTGEHPKKPKAIRSAILAILGIALIAFGYWLSGRMLNALLFINMIVVLVTTILGTFLLFRVAIGWVLYQMRKRKKGHLGLYNSLSLAPIMHRMKGNANSLTIITVLSAMTLTMLAGVYSLYYSTEKEVRLIYPFDFAFEDFWYEDGKGAAEKFISELDKQQITYTYSAVETLEVDGEFEGGSVSELMSNSFGAKIISDKQLQQAGVDIQIPHSDATYLYDAGIYWLLKTMEVPFNVKLSNAEIESDLKVVKVNEGNVLNSAAATQLVVKDEFYQELKELFLNDENEWRNSTTYVIDVLDRDQLAEASAIFKRINEEDDQHGFDYYSQYASGMENNGLFIFISGFLGLVFLISTGSILYFKQMTEAEQEKSSYATLRQLGFTAQDIMRGIVRKQVFVFGVPLMIGLLHSIFAIKAASFMFMSDITLPASIAMGIYVVIYLMFAFLTVGYYRKTVKAAF